ncbi:MAG: hypothetical protein ABIA04_05355 [Pseudomonadota bacterium]
MNRNSLLGKVGRLNVIKVSGDAYDRAFHHSLLLRDDMKEGGLAYFLKLTESMKKNEYYPSQIIYDHNMSRYERMNSYIKEQGANFDENHAVSLICDRYDPICKEIRAFPNTIGQVHNISSVIFKPGLVFC